LSWATFNGHLEAVKFLVEEGSADIELKCNLGWMVLSYVAENGQLEMVKLLVKEASADVESKDKWGNTALDLARHEAGKGDWREARCKAVVAWLEEVRRTTDRRSRAGLT